MPNIQPGVWKRQSISWEYTGRPHRVWGLAYRWWWASGSVLYVTKVYGFKSSRPVNSPAWTPKFMPLLACPSDSTVVPTSDIQQRAEQPPQGTFMVDPPLPPLTESDIRGQIRGRTEGRLTLRVSEWNEAWTPHLLSDQSWKWGSVSGGLWAVTELGAFSELWNKTLEGSFGQ